MKKEKALTYIEFIDLAKKHYCRGGCDFYECWDRSTFDFYVREFGHISEKKALKMFKRAFLERDDYKEYM